MSYTVLQGTQFFGSLLEKVRANMLPFQLLALKDEVPGAEKSHAIANFKIAAGEQTGEFYGCVFQDSDLGKWIEAAAYALVLRRDPALEAEVDAIVALFEKAQLPDGYLNTYFILKAPEMRFRNLRDWHELYCAGHLIEAAVAYFKATGKRRFLDVMCRVADCIDAAFGVGGQAGYPGHPELELALYKLYDATGDEKYARLANLFVDRRGTSPNYFQLEQDAREGAERSRRMSARELEYWQAHKPLREQERAVGHAVRAMYLYAGAADAARFTGDASLHKALDRLYANIVGKQMYITGGFGATHHGEAFDGDLELPNDSVYAETCASIAFIFFAKRMLVMHRRGDIADCMERALLNTVLSGANLACDRYFYVNPLETVKGVSGVSPEYRHALPDRPPWFGCACCPPNMARLLLSLYDYAYDFCADELSIHLYVDGTVNYPGVSVTHKSGYPWDGALLWHITCERPLALRVRVPAWSAENTLVVDGMPVSVADCMDDGYCTLSLAPGGHEIALELCMRVRRVYANAAVRADIGCVALMRGPLVYCFEGADNPEPLCALAFPQNARITEHVETEGVLAGMTTLRVQGLRTVPGKELYTEMPPAYTPCVLKAIPYFAWNNRGGHDMRVWMPER